MAELKIGVSTIAAGVGALEWHTEILADGVSVDTLTHALTAVSDGTLTGHGFHRLEVSLRASDQPARRAVLRAGFRQEGIRRQAHTGEDGSFEDVIIFARLISDVTTGTSAFSAVMNSVLPRKRLIAHVLIRADRDRFVLCQTTFKTDWELPGGIVELGESARSGAVREVKEELGVDHQIGPLLIADWLPPYLGWDDAVELIFDGGTVTKDDLDRFTLDGHEISAVRLVTLAEAQQLVTGLSHRRLTVAMALQPGTVAYLEDGRSVPGMVG